GTGMALSGTTFNASTTTALWNANQLQGKAIVTTAPTSGQALKDRSTGGARATDANATYTACTGMAVSGTTFNASTTTALWNANQLQGKAIVTTAPTSGQALKYNATSWAPATDANTTSTAGTGMALSGTTFNASTTTALWNASQLQGKAIVTTAPTSGQVL